MSLDLSPLQAALGELETFLGLREAARRSASPRSPEARAFEAASIQAFEFTYEPCYKLLRRYLEATMASPGKLAALSFPDLIRTAYGQGVVRSEWEAWSVFRNTRNITSHTYDPKQASIVLGALPDFLEEARFMLGRMQAAPAP